MVLSSMPLFRFVLDVRISPEDAVIVGTVSRLRINVRLGF